MISAQIPSTEIRHVRDAGAARDLFAELADLAHEVVAFAYLDPERRLLGLRHTMPGNVSSSVVPVRLVIADALAFDAASVVMAHNHPDGDPTPSVADRAITNRLARALHSIDIRLMDHIVLATARSYSFRAMGLL